MTLAEINDCEYSLAEHSFAVDRLPLTQDEILASLGGYAIGRKAAALQFARDLCRTGEARATDLSHAGFGEGEIVEIIATELLNVFETYFNNVTKTKIDESFAETRGIAA